MLDQSNPVRGPARKPEWAELTRLAGDGAAILFQDLRRRLGKIDGLQEELAYQGTSFGWTPRYRVGDRILFTLRIAPGSIEAVMSLESALRERLLGSPKVLPGIRESLRNAPIEGGVATVRVQLGKVSLVRSFANVVIMKSKLVRH